MTDPAELSPLIDELLSGWLAFVGHDGPELSDWRGRTAPQIATIMTLTAHVHQTAIILRPVLPDGLTIAHMPLVRSIFESTITLVWCDEVPDAANALINEGSRQRRNLRDSLAKTHSMAEMAAQINVVDGVLPTSSEQQARWIESRCKDIALDGAYALYRMLSGMGHASIDTVDSYLDSQSLIPGQPISVKSNPGSLPSSHAWSHVIACCLLWSGMVANYLDRTRSRRSALRRIAKALQVQAELPVKYNAVQRTQKRN